MLLTAPYLLHSSFTSSTISENKREKKNKQNSIKLIQRFESTTQFLNLPSYSSSSRSSSSVTMLSKQRTSVVVADPGVNWRPGTCTVTGAFMFPVTGIFKEKSINIRETKQLQRFTKDTHHSSFGADRSQLNNKLLIAQLHSIQSLNSGVCDQRIDILAE